MFTVSRLIDLGRPFHGYQAAQVVTEPGRPILVR